MKKILITGANGFIGKNLTSVLDVHANLKYEKFTREDNEQLLQDKLKDIDFIVHLAAINRSSNDDDFDEVNIGLTEKICKGITQHYLDFGKKIPIIYTSSSQAGNSTVYGQSKVKSERSILELQNEFNIPSFVLRLPNVFGKWCRPNYNSVIATFCFNVINDIPIVINDPSAIVNLVYIDDVVNRIIDIVECFEDTYNNDNCLDNLTIYSISVGEIANHIRRFKEGRKDLINEKVGTGFIRALYSTYVSYFRPDQFTYKLVKHKDDRGAFVEMLKTSDSGQFSYFTAYPGITRGGHYHHTKTEKFLVIYGKARFRFKNIQSGEKYMIEVDGNVPEVVETVPGWAHDITNIGDDILIVMLWANEVFDKNNPDTYFIEI